MTERQLKVVSEQINVYGPGAEGIELWRNGATVSWFGLKDNDDHELARRALLEQNLDDLVRELESAGALE
jgi:hypothetical protein